MANTIYGVYAPNGGSGRFIKSMLAYILMDATTDMDFLDGSSHSYYRNYLKKNLVGGLLSHAGNKKKYKYKMLASNTQQLVLVDSPSLPLNLQEIHDYGLIYKLIYINICEDDFSVLSANHFYKQPLMKPFYEGLSTMLFSTSDLSSLTTDQEKLLINHPEALQVSSVRDLNEWLSILPNEFHNSLYKIDFGDIMNNPNKVKHLLELVTNTKISIHAHRQYDRYVEKQVQFRKEKNF